MGEKISTYLRAVSSCYRVYDDRSEGNRNGGGRFQDFYRLWMLCSDPSGNFCSDPDPSGKSKDYFQYMTTVGEHYLKTELNHFRAYQEREEKMRSFRHDINNHLLCLKELAGHGDLERAKAYILELQTILGESRQDFYTGNEIADAILNEKIYWPEPEILK